MPDTMLGVLIVEFTIEPFVEGHPGPHVLSAIAAAEALGATVEFGPFGSSIRVPAARVGMVSGAVLEAAFANGATHVTLHAAQLDESHPEPRGLS
jgi:uncharacterized protein YqgV (UPF0045/DUF77 family)